MEDGVHGVWRRPDECPCTAYSFYCSCAYSDDRVRPYVKRRGVVDWKDCRVDLMRRMFVVSWLAQRAACVGACSQGESSGAL